MRLAYVVLILAGACGFGDNARSGPLAGVDAAGDASEQPPPDGPDGPDPDAPVQPACSILPQDGCAPGQACDFGTPLDGPFECRAITKTGTADSRCELDTECAAGFTCLVHDTDVAACSRFCDSDAQCGVNARCVHDLLSGGQPLGVRVCSNACNTLAQTGCPSGLACAPFEDGNRDFSDCVVPGTKPDGAVCADTSECLPGSTCVTVDGTSRCHELCNQQTPSTCPTGVCDPFSVDLEINGVDFGFCP